MRRWIPLCCAAPLLAYPLTAGALPVPTAPEDPAVASQWAQPKLRSTDAAASVQVDIIEATVIGSDVRIHASLTNSATERADDLSVRIQRAAPVRSVTEARKLLSEPESNYNVRAGDFRELSFSLAPGESKEETWTIPLTDLQLSEPGTYPLLVNLNGHVGNTQVSYLHSSRVLLTVPAEEEAIDAAPGLTLLWPISADTGLVAGETGEAPGAPPLILSDERLAGELIDGGRLDQLIDDAMSATTNPNNNGLRESMCLALDPELVSVVDRMSKGYSVGASRPSPVAQKKRLRDSWTSDSDTNLTPGTAQLVAGEWIAKVRTLASSGCTVALPWSDTDLDAVARTGNQWLMREAIARGPEVLDSILGVEVERNIVIPGSGYVTHPSSLLYATTSDPSEAWEQQQPTEPTQPVPETSLSDPHLPHPIPSLPPSEKQVHVLVADNSLPPDAPGVAAVPYQADLAATLSEVGDRPLTLGFSEEPYRYNHVADGEHARSAIAAASIRLALEQQQAVLAVPPSTLASPTAGAALLDAAASALREGAAKPQSLRKYIENTEANTGEGVPYSDPGAPTDTEILRGTQQANYIDDLTGLMVNDPMIAMSRYDFTTPLRRDILRSLAATTRRESRNYLAAAAQADLTLNGNRDMLQELRASVSLLPPGNVYTRTSESSPLLIVARNGLPLPVVATIQYTGDGTIFVPESLRIPAKGSITTQMTADLGSPRERADLTVWLASADSAAISNPVEISVQTRSGFTSVSGLVAAAGLAIALAARIVLRNRRKWRRTS